MGSCRGEGRLSVGTANLGRNFLTMVIDHGIQFEAVGKGAMMNQMEVITISKFKATCLAVLDQVKKTGQPVMVTRHGKPIAIIDPPPPPQKQKSWVGSFKSKGKITGDILAPVVAESEWHVLHE